MQAFFTYIPEGGLFKLIAHAAANHSGPQPGLRHRLVKHGGARAHQQLVEDRYSQLWNKKN